MKGKGLIALGTLGALAYLAANSNADTVTKADLAALGFTGSGNATADEVIQAILNSPVLRAKFKGEKGDTGLQGIQGLTGIAGVNSLTLGRSLLQNGALELGTLQNWTGNVIEIGEIYEGLPSILYTSETAWFTQNETVMPVDNRRLYKASFIAKATATYRVLLRRLDKGNTDITQGGSANIHAQGSPTFSNTGFEKKTVYFGGIDNTLTTSIGLNAAKVKLSVYLNAAGSVTFNKMRFEEVGLGEPVPYNLPYLPVGQMVIDPTTSEVGHYNGTAVVWFAS